MVIKKYIIGYVLFCVIAIGGTAGIIYYNDNKDYCFYLINVVHSLDFPYHIGKKKVTRRELRVFKSAQNGYVRLFANGNKQALQQTVRAVQKYCNPNKDRPFSSSDFRCPGAISALYYFNSKDEDDQIYAVFEKFANNKKIMIFSQGKDWTFNRPHADRWAAYVDAIQVDDYRKKIWKSQFETKRDFQSAMDLLKTKITEE